MNFGETLLGALHSLRSNRLRSVLTTFGIIIGVAAVIVLVALGNGMKAGFDAQFSALANQITVTQATGAVPGGGEARNLTDSDVTALRNTQLAPDIASVTPSVTGTVTLTAGQTQERASLTGATENYLDISDRSIATGSWFSDAQEQGNQKVAVLGEQAVGLLYGPTANLDQVVGSDLRINNTTFTVTGVLTPDGQNDNVVMTTLGAARGYLVGNDNGKIDQIIIKSTSADTVNQATNEATAILDKQHDIRTPVDRDYNVHSFTSLLTQRSQFIEFLTIFTTAVAAISLVVGGIGVANIMLVAVTERTREIGIRKAIGARRMAILKQFLVEAVLLTGLGGLVGVIVGVSVTEAAGLVLPSLVPSFPPPVLTAAPVLIAFVVSLAIGLVAGGYPANRAAGLRPIEALRFE
ncbi:MAG TPA: ABC transporter permease [Pseudonocardia sp.]|jgi:putative ABC transport system permease protein|nr:ABC transporter permease [Pseudonocardia sp.]